MQGLTVVTDRVPNLGVAYADGISQHRCKHWLKIAGRAADNLEYLRSRCLLLKRLFNSRVRRDSELVNEEECDRAQHLVHWRAFAGRLAASRFNWFAAGAGAPFHRLHPYGRERGIVAGPESTGHGLHCFGVGVERRDILGRYTSAARLGLIGKPRLPRGCASGCTWKNLSYVPAEVPERVAN